MYRSTPGGVALLAVFAAAPARGDVVVEQQFRQVDVAVEVWVHDNTQDEDVPKYQASDSASSSDGGAFSKSLDVNDGARSHGTASQVSTIGPAQFRAAGGVSVYSSSDLASSGGTGRSALRATFRADAPQQYLLSYDEFETSSAVGEGMDWDLRLLRLDDAGGSSTVFQTTNPFHGSGEPTPAPLSGVLAPGRYQFLFQTGQTTDVHSTWEYNVQFDLTTVPEPGAASLMLGGACLALLRRGRRRP